MTTTMKLIAKNVLGSDTASVTFSDIPQTYTDVRLVFSARSNRSAVSDPVLVYPNGSSANLSSRWLQGDGTSPQSATATSGRLGIINGNTATSSTFSNGVVDIPNYAGSTNKSLSAEIVSENNATEAYQSIVAGLWSNTAAITSLQILPSVGTNFLSGSSFFLYGITKA